MNSQWLAHEEIKSETLQRVLKDYEITEQPGLWLIYPKSNVVSVKVRVFMDYLTEHIGKAPAWDNYEKLPLVH